MTLLGRHPGERRVREVALDLASPRQRKRVMKHLADCGTCRARYRWLRTLPGRLEAATDKGPPPGVEAAILARRAAGERIILPVHAGALRPVRASLVRRMATVAFVIAGSATAWLALGPSAGADQAGGTLIFEPPELHSGGVVRVAYRPGSALEGEPAVVLRGILTSTPRYALPRPSPRQLAVLRRDGSVYRGELHVGAASVYSQIVVEDRAGTVVDQRAGRRWHLYAHQAGRPVRDALWAHALLAGSWQETYEALERAVELYPDDPRMRAAKLGYELATLGAAERDSVLSANRAVLRALGERDRTGSPYPDELVGLLEYARTVGDEAATDRWRSLLVERFPRHPDAVWYRVSDAPVGAGPAEIAAYLRDLDSLWASVGPHPALTSVGLWAARAVGDPAPILRWARREAANPGWMDGGTPVPLLLAATPAVLDSVPSFLRAEIERLDELRVPRPLGHTVQAHARQVRLSMRPLFVALADALEREGAVASALDTLQVAAAIGWSGSVHHRLARASLAVGDTAAAVRSLARAASPSFGRGADLDSVLALGRSLVPADEWELFARAGRDEMHRHVLEASTDRPLRESLPVVDGDGKGRTLGELRGGGVLLVAFWDPRSGPAVGDVPRLADVARVVRSLGGRVAVVTRSPWAQRSIAMEKIEGTGLALYHDLDRRATQAFQSTGAPEYHVVGPGGRIRFLDSPLEDVVAQIDALLNEPRLRIVDR